MTDADAIGRSGRGTLCTLITFGAVLIAVVLAIPACICLSLMEAVWKLADRMIRAIDAS